MSDQETTVKPAVPKAEVRRVTKEIANQLGETEGPALFHISRIVKRLGPARAEAFAQEARQVEANGGQPGDGPPGAALLGQIDHGADEEPVA